MREFPVAAALLQRAFFDASSGAIYAPGWALC